MKLLCVVVAVVLGGATLSQCEDADASMCSQACGDDMRAAMGPLARQLMLQQLYVEEMTRANGDSGLLQVRARVDGPNTYDTSNHANHFAISSIHQHKNAIRTCGMGELIAVLNGVMFRTRHNDYQVRQPSKTSGEYEATEEIPFPDVPPAVLEKPTVEEQITEMREWFKAWRDGNTTVRDYRPYFKPVLCYLEGAWTTSSSGDIDEPFDSTRHFIDAKSWHELQDYIRFTSYTGDKHVLENVAYLPTTIMDVQDGLPVYAQWNYRILCHPIDPYKHHIKPSELKRVDDLANRMQQDMDMDEFFEKSRQARFTLNKNTTETGAFTWSLLDDIMADIPGMNNYGANLTDNFIDHLKLDYRGADAGVPLNAAYYHRVYKRDVSDAMGESQSYRGYSDMNLFVAQTTHPNVSAMTANICKRQATQRGCEDYEKRYSYAIPIELIYLTPLSKWNPYDIEYKGAADSTLGATVKADGRNGRNELAKAYNGTNDENFYQTPADFYQSSDSSVDSADTGRNTAGVLDRDGNLRKTVPSGISILMTNIEGVGKLRQRFPVMPLHVEGSSIWKELEALRDIVNDFQKYKHILRVDTGFQEAEAAAE